jgi:OOP family OmpA-OmpF porin
MRKLLLLLPLALALSGCCACGTYVQKDQKPQVLAKEQKASVLVTEKTEAGTKIRLKGDASFDYRSSQLKPEADAALSQVAEDLIKSDAKGIQVVGYTDGRGTERFNNRLSLDRAQAVKKFLVSKGVKAGRITTSGVGSKQPIASNDTEEGRTKNRRVEITVKEKE